MPAMLRRAWQAWTRIAKRIGDVQARVILTVIYAAMLPFAIGVRVFSDPLRLKRRPTVWIDPPAAPATMDRARQQ